jgi:tetratricopeptide (TPR) repeat protein
LWIEALQRSREFPEGDQRTITTLGQLGVICQKLNRDNDAELYLAHELRLKEKALGEDNPAIAECWQKLGNAYLNTCKYNKAAMAFQKALQGYEKTLDRKHVICGVVCGSLARSFYNLDRVQEAELYFRRAIVILRHVLGDEHSTVKELLADYVQLLEFSGRGEEAQKVLLTMSTRT